MKTDMKFEAAHARLQNARSVYRESLNELERADAAYNAVWSERCREAIAASQDCAQPSSAEGH